MNTVFGFITAIAVLVIFHELGHYWIARLNGVKVLRFSIGFGKTLYTRRFGKGETEWVISAIPLGGYVKMLDEREGDVAPHEVQRAFNRLPVWRRMTIVVAGPLANLILAILLYWILFLYGVPGLKPVLGEVGVQTPAAAASLHAGETVLSVNGEAVPSWQEVRWLLLHAAMKQEIARVEVLSTDGGVVLHELDMSAVAPADLDGDFLRKLGLQPLQPQVAPIIGKFADDSVAKRAGLLEGDSILRIDGQSVTKWEEVVAAVRGHPDRSLRFDVVRNGVMHAYTLTPEAHQEGNERVGRIGAAPRIDQHLIDAYLVTVRYGVWDGMVHAVRKTSETAVISLKMMLRMVLGEVSLKNLSGPISIADYAGQSAKLGFGAYLGFLALLSISLGVLNLMPIPLLDGGHLLYYTAEWIKGAPVSERAWEIGQRVGIALLVSLMAFALYNDISRLIVG
ncbi:MAG: RIP metalloprotease RseP [Pseudomonadota bacterium]